MKAYFYCTDGTSVSGPVAIEELISLRFSGAIGDMAQICEQGSEVWMPLATVLMAHRQQEYAKTILPSKPAQIPIAPTIHKPKNTLVPVVVTSVVLLVFAVGGYFAYEAGVFGLTAKQKAQEEYETEVDRIMGRMAYNLKSPDMVVEYAIKMYNAGGMDAFIHHINSAKEGDSYARVIKKDEEISQELGALGNPPAGCEKLSSELDDLHKIYVNLLSGVYNSSGTAREYVNSYESDSNEFSSKTKQIIAMFMSKKNKR